MLANGPVGTVNRAIKGQLAPGSKSFVQFDDNVIDSMEPLVRVRQHLALCTLNVELHHVNGVPSSLIENAAYSECRHTDALQRPRP